MKNRRLRDRILLTLGAFLFLTGLSFGLFPLKLTGNVERKASQAGDRITVVALYPTVGTIRDLMTLRQQGLIDIPNLRVLGVYHEKEKTDYRQSSAFVAQHGLDWITFHPISAPIGAETVFKTNACTPDFEKVIEQADGIIFFGGPDIPPNLYREQTSFLTNIEDPYRHFLEVSFIFHLLGGHQDEAFKPLLDRRPDFPVLGICLGCQSLNVGTGGTLTQDIWSEVFGAATFEEAIALGPSSWHSNPYAKLFPREGFSESIFHEIQWAEAGRFQKEIGWNRGDHPVVFSSHHQQVEKLGKGFRVIASSLDGKIVEAIEHERYRHVLGVQFHPEAWVLFEPEHEVRFTPQDRASFTLKAHLEEQPGSLAFHKKFWAWVARSWAETHRAGTHQ